MKSKEVVLKELSLYPAGSNKRHDILSIDENRNSVLSTGASVVLYSKIYNSNDDITNIQVGIIERLNSKTGKREGVGNLGGLSERLSLEKFQELTTTEKLNAFGEYDNVIINNNKITLTDDLNLISINNLKREASEELKNINTTTKGINFNNISEVPLPNLKDDNYILNIWNGQGEAFAINPMVYTLETDNNILENIIKISKENNREKNTEVLNFKTINLTDALTRFGKFDNKSNMRDTITDYRYPHEWLGVWNLASNLLKNDEQKIIDLAINLQKKTPYLINFELAQKQTKQSNEDMAKTLGISTKGLINLKLATANQFNLQNKTQSKNI